MGESIKKMNLEIGLFVKELNSFVENVNEIDDETTKMLSEVILAVDRLMSTAQFRETPASSSVDFVHNFNDEHLECRRYIFCRLCGDQIDLNQHNYQSHIEAAKHKGKVSEMELIKSLSVSMNVKPTSAHDSKQLNDDKMAEESKHMDENLIKTSSSLDFTQYNDAINRKGNKFNSFNTSNAKTSFEPNEIRASSSLAVAQCSNTINRMMMSNKSDNLNISNTKTSFEPNEVVKTCFEEVKSLERSLERYLHETQIISSMKKCIDSEYKIIPFGSSQWYLGGKETNFNILLPVDNLQKSSKNVFDLIEAQFRQWDDFDVVSPLNENRAQKQQLCLVHKLSGIQCLILVDNEQVVGSTEIIQKAITLKPICGYLIILIRAWQNSLNKNAKKSERKLFEFNTYTISILVMFFLQMNFDLPIVEDIKKITKPITNDSSARDLNNFSHILFEFFRFYGERYQIWNHVISANIGQWQERRLQSTTRNLSTAKKQLRDGIEQNPKNWKNCTMYVQDLIRPGVNVSAEVSKKAVDNFQEMCQVFVRKPLCEKLSSCKQFIKIGNINI